MSVAPLATSLPAVAGDDDVVVPVVGVDSVSTLSGTVASFVDELLQPHADEHPSSHPAPDVADCFLPHPLDAPLYTRMCADRAGEQLTTLSTAELQTRLQHAGDELKRLYAEAKGSLHSLHRADLLAGSRKATPETSAPPATAASADDIARRLASLGELHHGGRPTVVQFALHTPSAGFRITQVILIAANQTLADLKAALQCVADKHATFWQERQGITPHGTGGLFYIDHTLYRDAHTPGCADYAEPVAAFLREQADRACQGVQQFMEHRGLRYPAPSHVPDIVVKDMHTTQISSLNLDVGHSGYQYVHAGACEHMLTVQDVRLLHAEDPQDLSEYPCTIYLRPPQRRRCCICIKRPSDKVVYNDELAPCTPAFFCTACFDMLHFDSEGNAIPSSDGMEVFPYFYE